MKAVSVLGSVSRRAGGLFESVRRLHQELLRQKSPGNGSCCMSFAPGLAAANATKPTDMNITVFGLRDEFTQKDLRAWGSVPVHTFKIYGPRTFGYSPSLVRELIGSKPELVHVHGLWQFTSVAVSCWHQKTRKPYLVSPHGMLEDWALRNSGWKKQVAWRAYERNHLNSATCLRALCQAEARSIRALGLTNPICIIPNGVDLPVSTGFDSESLRWPLINRKLLLYLGRIHPKKGLCNLLKAWAKLQPSDEWVLVLAGWAQGGHELELKTLASDLELSWTDRSGSPDSNISLIFPGPQFGAGKDELFRRCDAFILPSFSEGIPMAVLEAWAYAKPVLMTPQCNLGEGFAAGAAIPIGQQPEEIAAGLRELFRMNNSSRKQCGLRGRVLVLSGFAWPQIAADLRSVYYWVSGAGPKPSCVVMS